MTLNWTTGSLADGLHCYNTQQYFAAHEHWESLWLNAPQPEKLFLQALIQVTVAMHHYTRGNLAGATRLLNAARRKLESFDESFGGLDIAVLRSGIHACLSNLAKQPSTQLTPPRIHPLSL